MASQGTLRLFFFTALACFPQLIPTTAAKLGCGKLTDCACIMKDGSGVIALNGIDNEDGTPKFKGIPSVFNPSYTFDWNPCTPLKTEGPCQGSNACQRTTDSAPDSAFPAGHLPTTFSVNPDGTVLLSYAKVTYEGYTRAFNLTLKCDEAVKASFGNGISEYQSSLGSVYTGTFTSRCACPGKTLKFCRIDDEPASE